MRGNIFVSFVYYYFVLLYGIFILASSFGDKDMNTKCLVSDICIKQKFRFGTSAAFKAFGRSDGFILINFK